ncbi:ribosome-inactivating family protein [Streptomyces gilvus]|uniref:ribosome-inactivating family protein n=1 Tax=Streptomyces gilvus TaxID=2920937 RepID=UPI001F10AFEE|nr:ribosome-inactivating family protein [Streptomyces sp. CME 23]MCH5671495.1 ribosome-inactivating family protein [Streptomyces sp. CME 23]
MPRSHVLRSLGTKTVLAAALAAAAVTAVGTSGLPAAHHTSTTGQIQLAGAAQPTDGVSYSLATGVHRDFADRYDAIINDIRGRLRGTRLYGNIILTRNTDDYFSVTLGFTRAQVTLVINARNLYITGWRNDTTNVYYRLNEGPRLPAVSDTRNLPWVNYTDMERAAGHDRGSIGISMSSIQAAIRNLGGQNDISNSTRAEGLLVLTQAFAEAARFDFISYRVGQAIRGGTSWYAGASSTVSRNGSNSGGSMIDVTGVQFENNWQRLSNAARNSTNNHTTPHVSIGDGTLDTMSALDAQLAVALMS